jgi:hypothetical protein
VTPVLSLLTPDEVAALGGLPNAAIIGEFLSDPVADEPLDPSLLRVNQRFVELLHDVISRWVPQCPPFIIAAKTRRDGRMYVFDGRTSPQEDASPPDEDIIGSFALEAGEILAETYQPNAEYQVLSQHGLVQLSPFLRERLLFELAQMDPE